MLSSPTTSLHLQGGLVADAPAAKLKAQLLSLSDNYVKCSVKLLFMLWQVPAGHMASLYDTAWRRVAAAATTSPTSGDWLQVAVIIVATCAISLPVGLNTGATQHQNPPHNKHASLLPS